MDSDRVERWAETWATESPSSQPEWWLNEGFTLEEANGWWIRMFTQIGAFWWRSHGFTPAEAERWRDEGFHPMIANAWRRRGVKDPDEALRLEAEGEYAL